MLCAPPDVIMNLKRLRWVLRCLSTSIEIQIEPRHGGERDCCCLWTPELPPELQPELPPEIYRRKFQDSAPAEVRELSSRRPAGVRESASKKDTLPMSLFNLDFGESKPKFLSPNSFSTMAEITTTTSLYLLWKHRRCLRTISKSYLFLFLQN